jgi:hypothetical protein
MDEWNLAALRSYVMRKDPDPNIDSEYDLPNTGDNQLETRNVLKLCLIEFKGMLATYRQLLPGLNNALESSQRELLQRFLAKDPHDDTSLYRLLKRMFRDIQEHLQRLRFILKQIVRIIRMLNCFSQASHFENFVFEQIGRVHLPEFRLWVSSVLLSKNEERFLRQYVMSKFESNFPAESQEEILLLQRDLLNAAKEIQEKVFLTKRQEVESLYKTTWDNIICCFFQSIRTCLPMFPTPDADAIMSSMLSEDDFATLLLHLPCLPEPQFEMVLSQLSKSQPRSLLEQSLNILFPILVSCFGKTS